MNIARLLFAKVRSSDSLFQDIVGYEDVKKLFRMSLDSKEPVSMMLKMPIPLSTSISSTSTILKMIKLFYAHLF